MGYKKATLDQRLRMESLGKFKVFDRGGFSIGYMGAVRDSIEVWLASKQ